MERGTYFYILFVGYTMFTRSGMCSILCSMSAYTFFSGLSRSAWNVDLKERGVRRVEEGDGGSDIPRLG